MSEDRVIKLTLSERADLAVAVNRMISDKVGEDVVVCTSVLSKILEANILAFAVMSSSSHSDRTKFVKDFYFECLQDALNVLDALGGKDEKQSS